MAVRISSFLLSYFLSLVFFLYSFEKGFALSHSSKHTHTVQFNSLLPSSICNPSSTGPKDKASLKVIDKYGPCSNLLQDKNIDHAQNILRQDQARVDWINSRRSKRSVTTATATAPAPANDTIYQQDATTVPAQPGDVVGTGNYVVTVGFGTPKVDLTLAFDTGSDLTWTQCQPCAGSCYNQKEAIFDPSKSTSYSNVSCTSTECSQVKSSTGAAGCRRATSTCIYQAEYGDGSYSVGYVSKERLTLTDSDVIDNFLFGCGQNNHGLFGGSAGLFGLGRNKISIVEQASQKYNRLFSYCLPTTTSSTGYLTFGATTEGRSVQYTPMLTLSRHPSFYGLNIVGISVNGRQLEIPSTAFQSGAIIDSGTVITRLPASVYSALRSEFRKEMARYPLVSGNNLLDTCYDLSGSGSGTGEIPKIAFSFGGGTTVDLAPAGILYQQSNTQRFCLAFAGNQQDDDLTILGNVQQKTFQVVYDVGAAKIGFAPGGCN